MKKMILMFLGAVALASAGARRCEAVVPPPTALDAGENPDAAQRIRAVLEKIEAHERDLAALLRALREDETALRRALDESPGAPSRRR